MNRESILSDPDMIQGRTKTSVPILRVKVMVGDDRMTLLFPATSFVAGAKECRAANLREGQRIQIHQANGRFADAIVTHRPVWPSHNPVPTVRFADRYHVCKVCNHKFRDHPKDGRFPEEELTLLCDGETVTL